MSETNYLELLSEPLDAEDIEWRAGATNQANTSALALAYLTSRGVMKRLDSVLGIENWFDNYVAGPNGGVMCELSVRLNGEWITKRGIADNTDFEAIKGGESDSLKRAAVKFGIGRYLYKLPAKWVPCEKRGKSVILSTTPQLPAWALPKNTPQRTQSRNKPQSTANAPKSAPVANLEAPDVTLNGVTYSARLAEVVTGTGERYIEIDDTKLSFMKSAIEKRDLEDGADHMDNKIKLAAIAKISELRG